MRGASAKAPYRLDDLVGGVTILPVVHRNVGAVFGESERDPTGNAATGAGDQRNTSR
jgi:hypothetical protein